MQLSAPLLGACAKAGDAAGDPRHLKVDERISWLLLLPTGSLVSGDSPYLLCSLCYKTEKQSPLCKLHGLVMGIKRNSLSELESTISMSIAWSDKEIDDSDMRA